MEITTWKDYVPIKKKLAIVGFAPSRDETPWDNDEYEIWGLNEEYNFPWMKRYDLWFQMHPRWDFTREGNTNHYNHPNWLTNTKGVCMGCKGTGVMKTLETKEEVKCAECKEGVYAPPKSRKNLPIMMQTNHPDIPNSVAFPLEEATELYGLGYPYLTSSLAMMLSFAFLTGHRHVELYGFEMGTQTEYHYQRPNGEFIMGFLIAKGMKIILPPSSPIMKGELYGYKNMKTGFRQNLEMRTQFLEGQMSKSRSNTDQILGQLMAVQRISELTSEQLTPEIIEELLSETTKKYEKSRHLKAVVQGAITEVGNMTGMYDQYFKDNTEFSMESVGQFTNVEYNNDG